jgi:hypothetical protein
LLNFRQRGVFTHSLRGVIIVTDLFGTDQIILSAFVVFYFGAFLEDRVDLVLEVF